MGFGPDRELAIAIDSSEPAGPSVDHGARVAIDRRDLMMPACTDHDLCMHAGSPWDVRLQLGQPAAAHARAAPAAAPLRTNPTANRQVEPAAVGADTIDVVDGDAGAW